MLLIMFYDDVIIKAMTLSSTYLCIRTVYAIVTCMQKVKFALAFKPKKTSVFRENSK